MEDRKGKNIPSCASCDIPRAKKICMNDKGTAFKGCPSVTRKQVLADANREYEKPDVGEFARQASIQEAECYINRHERPYVLAAQQDPDRRNVGVRQKKMGYKRLGLAFCIGLRKEAHIVEDIFKRKGFEVVSVICKAGRSSKDLIGIKKEERIFQDRNESMCNPVYQAKLFNHEKTGFQYFARTLRGT